jgi:hypothetical protein
MDEHKIAGKANSQQKDETCGELGKLRSYHGPSHRQSQYEEYALS